MLFQWINFHPFVLPGNHDHCPLIDNLQWNLEFWDQISDTDPFDVAKNTTKNANSKNKVKQLCSRIPYSQPQQNQINRDTMNNSSIRSSLSTSLSSKGNLLKFNSVNESVNINSVNSTSNSVNPVNLIGSRNGSRTGCVNLLAQKSCADFL